MRGVRQELDDARAELSYVAGFLTAALVILIAMVMFGCASAPATPIVVVPIPPAPPHTITFDLVPEVNHFALQGADVNVDGIHQTCCPNGVTTWTKPADQPTVDVTITADGYYHYELLDFHTVTGPYRIPLVPLVPPLPPPASRQAILDAHESFQGAVLHTAQFGDLNWWPTAWVSLNAADRAASYPQIASWGDTDITVSATWDYGEAGQPYGSGQRVPPTNYFAGADYASADVAGFRASVKDVIQHTAANGQPFVPRIFMSGDNGFTYYMWAMPLIVRALQPQPSDAIDLTAYVKLQLCYDSCVPGWQPPSQIDEAILATRAACPTCVLALELSTGYPCWGGGDGCGDVNFNSPAGQALDEIDWEGNAWPPTNWDQYWQVLARLLGPAYVRPALQPASDDPPPVDWYLRRGTPRGPWGVQCLEPFTYQWVRDQVPADQVLVAFTTLRAMGCAIVDMPYPR